MENNTDTSKKPIGGIKGTVMEWAAQAWPVIMVIIIGLALIALFVGAIGWKIVGVLVGIWGVRELLRWWKAKKAGEFYCPPRAIIAYIILIILCIVLIVSLVGGSGPVSNVKAIEFDSFPNATVGEIIDGSMRNQDWSTETRGGMEYVYVYGSAPDLGYDQIGFEFSYEERGDYYYVNLTDVYAEGSWWGQLIAYSCFTEFYNNM